MPGFCSNGRPFCTAWYENKPEMEQKQNRQDLSILPVFCGAAYEARTRYLHLGKVALYQMS